MCDLYERISTLCKEKGISGYKLCKDLGMQPSVLTDLKMGRQVSLSAKNMDLVAAYFGVSVPFLLGTESHHSSLDEQIAAAENRQKKEPAPTNGNGLSMYEVKLLDWFRGLPAEKRQSLLSLGDAPADLRAMTDRE